MPKITFQHQHSLDNEEAQKRIQDLMRRFSSKYHFEAEWVSNDQARVSGKGLTGTIEMPSGQVVLSLDLSIFLAPFRSIIESEIAKEMKQALL